MIRIITDGLPEYKFPYTISNGFDAAFSFTLVQSYDKDVDDWSPRWCLIDADGMPLAVIEADSFDEIPPDLLAKMASDYVMSLHGLGEEDTGRAVDVQKIHNDDESYRYEITG